MPDRTARPISLRGWTGCVSLVCLAVSFCWCTSGHSSELRQSAIVKAVQRARPSVVNIRGEKTVGPADASPGLAEVGRRVNGMGTGVVIDPRGYILTNFHVVDGVQQIQVIMDSGRQLRGRLVARDLETDLAVIKIDVPIEVPVITIGNSADLMPAETVVAVGNAYGYEHTVTLGIISALHRAVQVSDAQFYDDLIQTDASINPGNSGGPLLNIDGEMIGINVAVRAGAQGIGFAIPVNKAMAVAANLLASDEARRAWHGVVLVADAVGPNRELVVASVEPNSPAAGSGLKAGDAITAVDDLPTARGLDFHRAMLERRPGEKVRLAVRRGGDPLTIELTLADPPQLQNTPSHPAWESLGLQLKPIPAKQFRQNYRTRYRGGLTVMAVRPDSPAANTGIRRGDVLVGMHVWETVSLQNVSYIIKRPDFHRLNPLKFYILRGEETLYGYLPIATKTARRP